MPIQIGEEKFFTRVDEAIENTFMRHAVSSAQDRLRHSRLESAEWLGNWEQWRHLGEQIRAHTLENLDYYLEELSNNVDKAGGTVFFAATAAEATDYIADVVQKKGAQKIVKSKSMVTEEISLNEALEKIGCDVLETDLAEFILQTDDWDAPSHIVVPSLHKNKEQIRDVFHKKLGYEGTSQPEELAAFARGHLRQKFLEAEVGITGCNFAVAESGSIVIVANEGNVRMTTALPKTQITVMGMERIVPTWQELDVVVSLLTRSAVGQRLTSYITGLTGPKGQGDADGPEEFHLVIVDNGRSDILGTEFQSVLHCIRCAACINVCPVYRHIGGHAYGSIYPGPIGAVLTPLLAGYEQYKELPYASSLCGACTEACPVRIPLHPLLIAHRRKIVEEEKLAPVVERFVMRSFQIAARSPRLFNFGTRLAPVFLEPFTHDETIENGPGPLKPWTDIRDFPPPSPKSFHAWMHARQADDGKGEE
ncbi:LutB/LldF family L-lactate oxidation iron-sulfur protein [Alicyclobacillus tolerans]|uniref:LutB/LldF family L-lactate oxidation iron-sulfur protein n=1 Tax=Alicyclobacillus tolerans TaxID=90970 RepID=UPI001EFFDB13|nr:LutB/LldF family L-lactate oxidation iron-sulfur protein [Alicyclobacillus tolerans]MCF8567539.1 LutB/LldF family L-lactate oxidation iron-sulfur protein [Alicyclobacillus tolerans]